MNPVSISTGSADRSLAIEPLPVSALRPRERNPRTHSKKQLRLLADSIQKFGFNSPILIDAQGGVIAGHARLEASRLLGMKEVPCLRLEHLSEAEIRAYVIADNRTAELAGWDPELLKLELEELADLNFDLTLTGFDGPELDALLCPMQDDAEDVPPLVDEQPPPVSQVGDLWLLGPHRLLCGDSTQAASYAQVLEGQPVQMVFTDPPYNVAIQGNVTRNRRHGEFVMASGEMSQDQFTGFLSTVFGHLRDHAVDGSLHFVCMDWRHLGEMLAAGKAFTELKNLIVWNKANAGMGSLYRSKHELIFVFKNGTAQHVNNVELGKHGRHRSNVWNYVGATSPHKGRSRQLDMHPTVKPVSMIADALLDCSNRNDWVLDPFGGSGSTLMAAERTGRKAALIELDPKYVDVIVQRWRRAGKGPVVHAQTQRRYEAIAAERRGGGDDLNDEEVLA